ncbi:sulfite exporter TauE/SafE family protein [Sinorhizobium kummerowiae]|uniref:Probable membrane transporter protein n=1 Tax=Sinorhizobium kummerowiae TaxID=158892 RepID=A0ABY8TDM5_9HYPH|nr:sulfite exporter TauE/SafE family protein [Sinorhizobium kummerowiae]WHS95308.1 sulfite exporter TauE/SafE family protein [Sinorhizobium kummerowiae]WRW47272.1 sulfite exporter TauE/SafE family protein [Sinorhizobium kummerowiae]
MLPDIDFYLVAVPAVLLVGLSKGGMGEALSLMGVPILSMAVSPVQAAALLLPILIAMDIVSLWIWRKHGDRPTLVMLLPGALAGIVIGWATSAYVPRDALRLIIGLITVVFVLRYVYTLWRSRNGAPIQPKPQRAGPAALWGSFAGYGSFVAHAGGPPFQIYALPLKLAPREYTGTIVRFFAILNAVKLIPYFALGQLDLSNLKTSATLFPLAMVATACGAWIVRRMKPQIFYPFMYTMAFLAGSKLVWDGLRSIISGGV